MNSLNLCKELLQVFVIVVIGNNGGLNILVAYAAVRAASAERATCRRILGKAYFVALRARLTVVGTVPTFIADGAAILGYIVATDSAGRAFGSLALFTDFGAVVVVRVVGIHTSAAALAMQAMLGNAIGASTALRASGVGVLGKAYFGAERAWHAVSVAVPAVAAVGAAIFFKTLTADKAGNAFIGRHAALAVFGAVAVAWVLGIKTCVAIGTMQTILLNALFARTALRAAVVTVGFDAVVAELAEPLVVLTALAAVFAVIEATANILVASLTLGAMHIVAHGAVFTQAARFANQVLVFGIAYSAIGAEIFFVAVDTSCFVVGTPIFHNHAITALFTECINRFMTVKTVAATGITCFVQACFAI